VSPLSPIDAISAILTTPLRRTTRIQRPKTVSPRPALRAGDASRGEMPGAKRGVA